MGKTPILISLSIVKTGSVSRERKRARGEEMAKVQPEMKDVPVRFKIQSLSPSELERQYLEARAEILADVKKNENSDESQLWWWTPPKAAGVSPLPALVRLQSKQLRGAKNLMATIALTGGKTMGTTGSVVLVVPLTNKNSQIMGEYSLGLSSVRHHNGDEKHPWRVPADFKYIETSQHRLPDMITQLFGMDMVAIKTFGKNTDEQYAKTTRTIMRLFELYEIVKSEDERMALRSSMIQVHLVYKPPMGAIQLYTEAVHMDLSVWARAFSPPVMNADDFLLLTVYILYSLLDISFFLFDRGYVYTDTKLSNTGVRVLPFFSVLLIDLDCFCQLGDTNDTCVTYYDPWQINRSRKRDNEFSSLTNETTFMGELFRIAIAIETLVYRSSVAKRETVVGTAKRVQRLKLPFSSTSTALPIIKACVNLSLVASDLRKKAALEVSDRALAFLTSNTEQLQTVRAQKWDLKHVVTSDSSVTFSTYSRLEAV